MYRKEDKVMFYSNNGDVHVGTIVEKSIRQIEDEYEDEYHIKVNEELIYLTTEEHIINKIN